MDRKQLQSLVERVTVFRDRIEILRTGSEEDRCISVPATLISRSGERRLAVPIDDNSVARRDPALIKLIVNAHRARQLLTGNEHALADAATKLGVSTPYFAVLLRLSYLAPDITAAILDGRQPATLNRQRLAPVTSLPKEWQAQRMLLGFA